MPTCPGATSSAQYQLTYSTRGRRALLSPPWFPSPAGMHPRAEAGGFGHRHKDAASIPRKKEVTGLLTHSGGPRPHLWAPRGQAAAQRTQELAHLSPRVPFLLLPLESPAPDTGPPAKHHIKEAKGPMSVVTEPPTQARPSSSPRSGDKLPTPAGSPSRPWAWRVHVGVASTPACPHPPTRARTEPCPSM